VRNGVGPSDYERALVAEVIGAHAAEEANA
jgi:hypothetical protein